MKYEIKIEINELEKEVSQAGTNTIPHRLLTLNDSDEDLTTLVKRAEQMLSLYTKD